MVIQNGENLYNIPAELIHSYGMFPFRLTYNLWQKSMHLEEFQLLSTQEHYPKVHIQLSKTF